MTNSLRSQVLNLYKNLLYMGREYPQGYDYFQTRCNAAFKKNKDVSDPQRIGELVKHGEYVIKELKALYYLRKYRTLKRRYYADHLDTTKFRLLSVYASDNLVKDGKE